MNMLCVFHYVVLCVHMSLMKMTAILSALLPPIHAALLPSSHTLFNHSCLSFLSQRTLVEMSLTPPPLHCTCKGKKLRMNSPC
uniref:Secreted protein n=1 Tax=Labrus bergylta TaxID=56723 RepID=A0A3Q3KWF4_9LABR